MGWSTAIGVIGSLALFALVVFLIYRLVKLIMGIVKESNVHDRRADEAELKTKEVVVDRNALHVKCETLLGEKKLVIDHIAKVTAALVRLQDQIKEKKLEEIDHASLDELRALSLAQFGGVPVVPNVPEASDPSPAAPGGDNPGSP